MHMKSLIYISFLILFSCSPNKDTSKSSSLNFKEFGHWIKSQNKNLNDSIIIIPDVGCTGCISSAQKYFHKNIANENNLFVFTKISDLKMFKEIVNEDLWSRNNILIDSANLVMNYGLDSIYPLLIEKKNLNQISITNFQPIF